MSALADQHGRAAHRPLHSVITDGAERTRRLYKWLTIATVVFVICGSLVPYRFVSVPPGEVLGRFTSELWLHLPVASRSDLVANVLLMIPFGICMGGFFGRPATRWRAILSTILITGAGAGLSVSLEFLQTFLPDRVVSLRDVIAESAGAFAGSVVWLTFGPAFTERVVRTFRTREPLTAAERWLFAYVVFLAAWNVMPLDLSIAPSMLFNKYRDGVLVTGLPFAGKGMSAAVLGECALDILLWIPVGVAASLFWRPRGFRRSLPVALVICFAIACGFECSHIFLESRSVDLQAMLANAIGACGGSVLAAWTARRAPAARIPAALGPASGTVGWAAIIVCLKWYPFDFVSNGQDALVRFERLMSWSSFAGDGNRTAAVAGTFLLAMPLGVLLRQALGRGMRIGVTSLVVATALVACLWIGVEIGVALLPTGVATLAQVPVGAGGALVGLWVGGGWQ